MLKGEFVQFSKMFSLFTHAVWSISARTISEVVKHVSRKVDIGDLNGRGMISS